FSTFKPYVWTKVLEARMVPKTFVGQGRMRFAGPNGGMEPIGNRIITLRRDQSRRKPLSRQRPAKAGALRCVRLVGQRLKGAQGGASRPPIEGRVRSKASKMLSSCAGVRLGPTLEAESSRSKSQGPQTRGEFPRRF